MRRAPRPVGAAPGRVGVRKKGMIAGQRQPGCKHAAFLNVSRL
ncbi:hypothetical protein BURPS668_2273 [Burkholderia pseudomallei 668]|nr:hypothetical protein BURPS668_2273 [Burkholderia pseudomallei 668]